MREMNEQGLNKKLAEFAGFKPPHPRCNEPNHMSLPNEYRKDEYFCVRIPNFTQSLDACFKWFVPVVLEEYNIEFYSFKQRDNWYYSETNIWRKGNTKHNFEVLHDEHIAKHFEQGTDLDKITALALCLAIEKLIDNEKENRAK